jgi:hypothetical protein
MNHIIRHGNGFALWTNKFEEVSKAYLLLFVKGLHEWMEGEES